MTLGEFRTQTQDLPDDVEVRTQDVEYGGTSTAENVLYVWGSKFDGYGLWDPDLETFLELWKRQYYHVDPNPVRFCLVNED